MTPETLPWMEGAACATAAGAGLLAYAVRVPSCSLARSFGLSRRATPGPPSPSPSTTAPANPRPSCSKFWRATALPPRSFQCGANVRRLARRGARSRRAPDTKSATIPTRIRCSRSNRPASSIAELAAAQEAIEHATGVRPRYFRAPYGVRWFGLRASPAAPGPHRRDVEHHCARLETADDRSRLPPASRRDPGAILCLHDGRVLEHRPDIGVTLQAVRELLPKLMEQGFHFEKVTDILCPTKN